MFQYTQSASGRSYMHPVVTDRRCGNAATATANVEYILRAWSLDTHHHMTWKVKGAAKLKTCHAISAIFNYTSLQQKSETKHGILSQSNSIIMARALEKSFFLKKKPISRAKRPDIVGRSLLLFLSAESEICSPVVEMARLSDTARIAVAIIVTLLGVCHAAATTFKFCDEASAKEYAYSPPPERLIAPRRDCNHIKHSSVGSPPTPQTQRILPPHLLLFP